MVKKFFAPGRFTFNAAITRDKSARFYRYSAPRLI